MSKPLHILLVDDSSLARIIARRVVTDLVPDAIIMEAVNGEEAIKKVTAVNGQVSHVMMDLNMPGIDGFATITHILAEYPHCKFALCTANIQDAIASRAHEMGVSFIPKPIDREKLKTFILGGGA